MNAPRDGHADGAPVAWTNVVQLASARVAVLGARAGLFFVLGLALPPATFGVIAILFALGVAANMVLEMGIGLWLTRQGAVAREDTLAALGGLVIIRLVSVVPVLAAYLACARGILGAEAPLALALAVGLFHLLLQVCQTHFAFLRGAERPGLEATVSALLHGAELAVIAVWFVGPGRSPTVLFAVLAALRAAAVLGLTSVVVRHHGARLDARAALTLLRDHAGVIRLFALLSLAQFVNSQSDTLLLGLWTPTSETGAYWACYRLLQNLLLPVDLLLLSALPRIASACSNERLDLTYRAVHRLGGSWALCVIAIMLTQPHWVLGTLLHAGFHDAAPLLTLVAVAVGVLSLPPYGLGLTMTDSLGTMLRVYGVAAALNLTLNLVLIPLYGAWGAAMVTLITHITLKVLFARAFRARGLDPWSAKPLLIAALPLAAWSAVVTAWQPRPWAMLLLLTVAVCASLAPGVRPFFQRSP